MTGAGVDGERPPESGWLPDTPVDDNLLRQFLHNQADLCDAIATGFGGTTARAPAVALAASRCVVPYFNEALLLRPVLDADDPVLDEIDEFYATSDAPAWVLLSAWPTPPLQPRGWQLGGHPAFVVRTPGARLRPAADRPGVDLRLRLATSFHGCVNLCGAATLPQARRTGAWGALVRERVGDAPDLAAVAFTSDYSRPGFEHLGFVSVLRFTMWMRTASSGRTSS